MPNQPITPERALAEIAAVQRQLLAVLQHVDSIATALSAQHVVDSPYAKDGKNADGSPYEANLPKPNPYSEVASRAGSSRSFTVRPRAESTPTGMRRPSMQAAVTGAMFADLVPDMNAATSRSSNSLLSQGTPSAPQRSPRQPEILIERTMSGLEPLDNGTGGGPRAKGQSALRTRDRMKPTRDVERTLSFYEPTQSADSASISTPLGDSIDSSRLPSGAASQALGRKSASFARDSVESNTEKDTTDRLAPPSVPHMRGRSLSAKVAQAFLRQKSRSKSDEVEGGNATDGEKEALEAMMDGEVKREGPSAASRSPPPIPNPAVTGILASSLASPSSSAFPSYSNTPLSLSLTKSFSGKLGNGRASRASHFVGLKRDEPTPPELEKVDRRRPSLGARIAHAGRKSFLLPHHVDAGSVEAIFGAGGGDIISTFTGLHPNSPFLIYWSFFMSMFYILLIWLIPVIISIERLRHCYFGLSIAITVIYALDIVIYLLTAPEEKHSKNTEAAVIAKSTASLGTSTADLGRKGVRSLLRSKKKYLKRRLIFELVATIPWDIVLKPALPNHHDLFLLIRVGRLVQLKGIIKRSPVWLKDMWYGVEPDIDTVGEQYSLGVIIAVSNLFQLGYRVDDSAQQWMVVVFVISGAVLYAVIVGTISSFSFGLDASGRLYNQKLDEVSEYLRYKGVPDETRKKVLQYYQIKYRGKFFEENEILGQLNEALRMEIAIHNCRELITKVPFLQRDEDDGRDAIFIGRVASALQSCYYVRGDVVCAQGETGDAMYFILLGTVGILVNGNPVASLQAGSFFGEVALIAQIPRTATVIARTACHLYRLARSDFLHILETFDDMRMRIDRIYQERMKKVRQEEEAKRLAEEEASRLAAEEGEREAKGAASADNGASVVAESDQEGEDPSGGDVGASILEG
ncbi:Potassium voltage-gated channel sub H member 7 [Rhizophlyctis rosea]|uniref:Potassium voltage-gated channel sub H member 7 n=1 Tax=Rhizophlyctis rosea TaxID=64517 RepID=A0AAD5SEH6_9FUNG|nr:Potassium voltage-gated channel sub H member 7 [Rhizophlyctis rosea]